MELLLASANAHKARELGALLPGHRLLPLPASVTLPPETGATFAANARLKAGSAAAATGRTTLADDSGIEAAALGGRPGVRSARFAGEGASDEENLAKLLREVAPEADRRVAYVCVLALVLPDEGTGAPREVLFEGRCTGELALEPRGTGGFGYDPAFVPDDPGDGRTMAELGAHEKDAVSHRGRAARALLEWLDAHASDGSVPR
jgi:XTP/dITP diphosphohydrolase